MQANGGGREPMLGRLRGWFTRRLPIFWDNWLAASGSMLVVVTVFLLILMFFVYLYNAIVGRESNPYVDLIGFMLLPAFLLLGLALILVGNLVRRSREKREGAPHVIGDLLEPAQLRRVLAVGVGTFAILIGLGLFSFEAYHYTDSNQFCSYVCHEVMAPEATAHASSPHANVRCVDCHIGPGASWFVRAKLSGIRQVYAVLTDDFHRPIPTPVENLRPARETCEVCHWPARFHGSRLVAHERYQQDRDNTATTTALVLHVGGPDTPGAAGGASGIHWHIDPGNQVRYRHLDREREDIVEVVQTTPDGEIRYLRDGAEADSTAGTWRVMDCLDCHNRPTHIYDLPHRAVDLALAVGALDPAVPWLRKEGERVLREVQPGDDTAALLATRLREIYAEEHPEDLAALEAGLEPTAARLAQVLERNVWPQMNLGWGTYRSNLSHFDADGEISSGGCFRCHDEAHVAESGETISQDCELCHSVLAMEEPGWAGLQGIDPQAFLKR
ncbi:MAG TPA: NapC/NirT family cytochrome c [Candidatus Krumholzibacteria bacterium]|nr:NapC/NirT family cytochrome c [Candidatus Krumholzibacteria bacterium]HPD72108.1 NapC/NirT family cytochrome c [Candidatus Krumholzibacteria bacterium]HRY40960.1 NapC/NirT family cytochrome c [Candidatus Krumholzibacteria bacterium]